LGHFGRTLFTTSATTIGYSLCAHCCKRCGCHLRNKHVMHGRHDRWRKRHQRKTALATVHRFNYLHCMLLTQGQHTIQQLTQTYAFCAVNNRRSNCEGGRRNKKIKGSYPCNLKDSAHQCQLVRRGPSWDRIGQECPTQIPQNGSAGDCQIFYFRPSEFK
jgi:hypothetical protein